MLDANGNWVTDPDHVTLIFTVTTTTPTAEVMTTKVGDQEVRIGKTDYILAGDNMGPAKLEKAAKLGVKIINEDEFLNMIAE